MNKDSEYFIFINLLKKIRLSKKISQKELAKKLGKPQSYVSKYETGERRIDFIELRKICLVLEINIIYFIELLEKEINKIQNKQT